MESKKGSDKIISVYWFAILFIVAGAIVYVVSIFYGQPYDVRSTEAEILIDKVADRLSSEGYLIDDWKTLNDDNFLERSRLTFSTEDDFGWNADQHYLEIEISEFGNTANALKEISVGNENLKTFCTSSGESLPHCLQRSFYVLDREYNSYEVNILSIVRKTEKNA
jgi:hypothetical protein